MLDTDKRSLGKLSFNERGAYSSSNEYSYLDAVEHDGTKYVYTSATPMMNIEPGSASDVDIWTVLGTIIAGLDTSSFTPGTRSIVGVEPDGQRLGSVYDAQSGLGLEAGHVVFRNGQWQEELRPELVSRVDRWMDSSSGNNVVMTIIKTKSETYRFFGWLTTTWASGFTNPERRPSEIVFEHPQLLDATRVDGETPGGQIVPMTAGGLILEHDVPDPNNAGQTMSAIHVFGFIDASLRLSDNGTSPNSGTSSATATHFPAKMVGVFGRDIEFITSSIVTSTHGGAFARNPQALAIDGELEQIVGLTDGMDAVLNMSVFGASGGLGTTMTEVTGVQNARIIEDSLGRIAIIAHTINSDGNRIIAWGNGNALLGVSETGFISPSSPHVLVSSASGLAVFHVSTRIYAFAFNLANNVSEVRLGGRNDAHQLGLSLDPTDDDNADEKPVGLIAGNLSTTQATWNGHVQKIVFTYDERYVFILLTDGRLYVKGRVDADAGRAPNRFDILGGTNMASQFQLFPEGAAIHDALDRPIPGMALGSVDDVFTGFGAGHVILVFNNRKHLCVTGGLRGLGTGSSGLGLSRTASERIYPNFATANLAFIPPTWDPAYDIIHVEHTLDCIAVFTSDGKVYTAGGTFRDGSRQGTGASTFTGRSGPDTPGADASQFYPIVF